MLSKADDYPVHQRPEPIATAGTDRNFYDRYFFNAADPDRSHFVAAALGVYPHLNIIDAAVCWMVNGQQRSVFASRNMNMERMDTHAGPICVEVIEPLRQLVLRLGETDGLSAELLFEGRHPPIEEPRFTLRQGPRTVMDVTRMTQNIVATGHVTANGVRHAISGWRGTRDRSWGVRPIGAADPQPAVPVALPQFFWLWAPLNFAKHCLYFHSNDHADGSPWNRSALLVDLESGAEVKLAAPEMQLTYRKGGRRIGQMTLSGNGPGGRVEVRLSGGMDFHMHGVGYGHPRYGHGVWRGDIDVQTERFDSAGADVTIPGNAHVQSLVSAELRLPDGSVHAGQGVVEQLFIGPHAPSGFRDLFDPA
ncbi:MAG: hypothetical protein KGZ61_06255 [Sandarakinorhabdus sp.]|nr:hypothetical protein [Sandarakinorhabdus sp.]